MRKDVPMSNSDFLSMVENTPNLIIAEYPEEGTARVVAKNGRLRVFDVRLSDIQRNTEQEMLDVLFGRREAKIIDSFSRVVGYYSSIRNWNLSKRAELRDRGRGNYVVSEAPTQNQHH
jgi:hypothetical protein